MGVSIGDAILMIIISIILVACASFLFSQANKNKNSEIYITSIDDYIISDDGKIIYNNGQ